MSPPKRTWSTIATGTTLFLVLFVALHHQQLADLASGSPSRPTPGALLRVIPDPGKDRGLAACDVANLRYIGKDTITGCRALDPPQPTLLRAAESVRWVAAYGDSLTRSPFFTFVDLTVGRAWKSKQRAFNKRTYHNDHVFCCRDLRSRRTCRFERKGVEYNVTTLEVVQSFLTLTNKGTGFCYSWMWAPFADAKLEARTTAALRSEVPPDLLILNPGLHSLMVNHSLAEITKRSGHLFSSVLEAMRQQPPGPRTKTLIHEVAYLQEAEIPPKKRGGGMTNANVQLVNEYSEEWYQANQAPEEVGIVPIYRLSEAGDVKPQGDGIHMQGHFQQLVLHIDFFLGNKSRNPLPLGIQ